MRHSVKSRFPAANVPRLHDDIAMYTVFSDEPALDDGVTGRGGCTMVQVFYGKQTGLTAVALMHKESSIPQAMEDFIRTWGAPH